MDELDKAIKLETTSSLAYINKGNYIFHFIFLATLYLHVKQDPASAEVNCRLAVELDPLSQAALVQLAHILYCQDKITEAIRLYDKALRIARTKNELIDIICYREGARAQLFVTQVVSIISTNV